MSKHGRREKFVPRADPNSYYGRPILKPPAWDWRIPAYLFAGGLSAGSTLLSTGADLSGRPLLRRRGRIAAVAALGASTYFLVSDLGRPERFHHMLRVAKPTSPMSVGTWIIAGYSPGIGLAAVSELLPARWRAHAGSAGCCAGWPARPRCRRRRSPRRWPPTPRCCCRRPRCRPGTSRTPTCRSSSPARPRPAPAGWAC